MKYDNNKAPIALLITENHLAFRMLGIGRVYGNIKYGVSSLWRYYDGDKQEYAIRTLSSILRHLQNPFELDTESGLPHIIHAMTQLLIYSEFNIKTNINGEHADPLSFFESEFAVNMTIDNGGWKEDWEKQKTLILSSEKPIAFGDLMSDFKQTISQLACNFESLKKSKYGKHGKHEIFNWLTSIVLKQLDFNNKVSKDSINNKLSDELILCFLGLQLIKQHYNDFDIDTLLKNR